MCPQHKIAISDVLVASLNSEFIKNNINEVNKITSFDYIKTASSVSFKFLPIYKYYYNTILI